MLKCNLGPFEREKKPFKKTLQTRLLKVKCRNEGFELLTGCFGNVMESNDFHTEYIQ